LGIQLCQKHPSQGPAALPLPRREQCIRATLNLSDPERPTKFVGEGFAVQRNHSWNVGDSCRPNHNIGWVRLRR
jgi:hypothetical protein